MQINTFTYILPSHMPSSHLSATGQSTLLSRLVPLALLGASVMCAASCGRGQPLAKLDPPEIEAFSATPQEIRAGDSVRLNWAVWGADLIAITPEIGDVSYASEAVVRPTADTTYVLTASNAAGEVTASAKVSIQVDRQETVDQAYLPTRYEQGFGIRDEQYYRAQTFAVGRPGRLTGVDLALTNCSASNTADILVAIRAVSASLGGPILTSGRIAARAIPFRDGCGAGSGPSATLVHAVLDPPLPVQAGDTYAIWASTDGSLEEYGWWGDSDSDYVEGAAQTGTEDGSLVVFQRLDLGFKTYVTH